MKFRVIIRGYNCAKYLAECLKDLTRQTYANWEATIILDAPTDKSYHIARKYAEKDDRIKVFKNKRHKGVAANIWRGIKYAEPEDEDVIAFYDADDGLEKKALTVVAHQYRKFPNLLITYGSFLRTDTKKRTRTSNPYNSKTSVRKQKWHGSHLKTFKYKLFKHFPKKYLKDRKGNWFCAASDLALMFPLFEMAGWDRVKHVEECIYIWRFTSKRVNRELQIKNEALIRNKKPLKRLKEI